VKVADFSIARAATDEDSGHSGELLAAGGYLAPELADGHEPDGRADVYGVGACLFEMLTGREPTGARGGGTGPLSPRAIRAGVPRELDAVVLRAMASNPSDRYPNARAMASALARSAASDHTGPATLVTVPQPPPPTELVAAPGFLRHEGRWLGWTLVLVGLVAALVVVGLTLNRSGVINLPGTHQSGGQRSTASSQPQSAAISITAANAFDPFADGNENNGDAGNAIDGNSSTDWKTQHYKSAEFGGLKQGLGLVLDAGDPKRAKELNLQLLYPGSDIEVYGAAAEAPSDFEGWAANKLGDTNDARQSVELSLSGSGSYRYYLIWFTKLPPASDGGYQQGVAEASLKS
jgi:eukaryotic-like serine/threonine-protein kinase